MDRTWLEQQGHHRRLSRHQRSWCDRNVLLSWQEVRTMRYSLALVVLLLSGCFRLDDNLLSPGDAITEYKLDDFTGEVDFRLDPSMRISQFSFVDLNSVGLNGDPSANIKAIYLGD